MKLIGWLIGIVLFGAGIIFGISAYLGPDDLSDCASMPSRDGGQCIKADAIVAISGGDTVARTSEAIRLYQNGWADTLIFSGAAYDKDSPSNARAMKFQALAAGVPESAIEIEEYARDTEENALRTLSVASERGAERIILVTSAYHQRRAVIEFRQTFGNLTVVSHPVKEDKHWSDMWWTTARGWYLALGELVKIIISSARGI